MSKLAPIVASMRTDNGRVHDHNEDFITCWEPKSPADEMKSGWLYIVADGVGGAEAGEIASQYASERVLEHYLANKHSLGWGERIHQAMLKANSELRQLVANEHEGRRMATTMVTAVINQQQAYIANVGDSRAYHWRAGHIEQVTKDQSLVAKLVEEGAITPDEAENHPYQNVILYSIGSDKNPKIDLFQVPLVLGDMLILCSDGLTKHVSDREIGEVVDQLDPNTATQTLIKMANERGGKDNISVAVLRYGERPATLRSQFSSKTAADASRPAPAANAVAMWLYTIFLGVIQTILIFIAWILLRV